MNTFAIKTINAVNELSTQEQAVVHAVLIDAVQHDLFVSIQGEAVDFGDYEDVHLYGCYTMTAEEVMSYYSSGGLWEYYDPRKLLNEVVAG